jgi:hypothetical protein
MMFASIVASLVSYVTEFPLSVNEVPTPPPLGIVNC